MSSGIGGARGLCVGLSLASKEVPFQAGTSALQSVSLTHRPSAPTQCEHLHTHSWPCPHPSCTAQLSPWLPGTLGNRYLPGLPIAYLFLRQGPASEQHRLALLLLAPGWGPARCGVSPWAPWNGCREEGLLGRPKSVLPAPPPPHPKASLSAAWPMSPCELPGLQPALQADPFVTWGGRQGMGKGDKPRMGKPGPGLHLPPEASLADGARPGQCLGLLLHSGEGLPPN